MSDRVEISIDLDKACTRCGSFGATGRGLCLECIRKEVVGMAPQQMSLTTEMVELSPEEKVERGWQLACLLRERRLMDDEHKERRDAMKKEREGLEHRIEHLSEIVRVGKEERPIGHTRG